MTFIDFSNIKHIAIDPKVDIMHDRLIYYVFHLLILKKIFIYLSIFPLPVLVAWDLFLWCVGLVASAACGILVP